MDSSNTNGLCKPVVIWKFSKRLREPTYPWGNTRGLCQVLMRTQCWERQLSCLFQTSNDLPAAREGCCASW
jgi:hypothetical protein